MVCISRTVAFFLLFFFSSPRNVAKEKRGLNYRHAILIMCVFTGEMCAMNAGPC